MGRLSLFGRRVRRFSRSALGACFLTLGLVTAQTGAAEATPPERTSWQFFPEGELFEPLVADVRWPRFSAAHQWRLGSDEFDRLGAVSFGETFAFVRGAEHDRAGPLGQWEFGIQAAVYSIFDLTAVSFDLANSDFFVGLNASVSTRRDVTAQLRVYHISSHLGDEYLLENDLRRIGVSFEVLDALASYRPLGWLRIYGGGGVIFNSTPDFEPVILQSGLEASSPRRFVSGYLTPIFGVDLQVRQEHDWIPEVATLVGLRIAKPGNDVRALELFARYYHGRSPDGQFFEQTIDSVGLGLRLAF